jgi:4-hydroxybenzoate polyprenyltransferase
MNNQTKSILPHVLAISMGHLAAILSLLFILMLILLTLCLLFTKRKRNSISNENELSSQASTSINERRSFPFRRSRRYSSTMNSGTYTPNNSFQLDIDEQNTRSSMNLIPSK